MPTNPGVAPSRREDVKKPRQSRQAGPTARSRTSLRLVAPIAAWNPAARRDAVYRRLLAGADVVAAGFALLLSVSLLGDDRLTLATLVILPLVVLVSKAIGLYDRDELLLRKTTLDEVPALFQLATLYALATWLLGDVFVDGDISRLQLLGLWQSLFFSLIVGRALMRQVARRVAPAERCLLLGDETTLQRVEDNLATSAPDVQLVGRVAVEQDGGRALEESEAALEHLEGLVHREAIDRIIVAAGSLDADRTIHVVTNVKALGVKVSVLPRLFEVVGSNVEFDELRGQTVLALRRFGLSASSRLLKRAFDLVGASVCLIVLAPLLGLIALAIKLDSPGAVLFRQIRIGRDGKPFFILKFRSMEVGAETRRHALAERNETAGLFKMAEDPRVTRAGRFLRKTALDELPQLLNVLKGEMSLVGPRPLVEDEDKRVVGYHRRRLHIMPGVTGPWQLLGGLRVPLNEMVAMDYLYVGSWSLWQDVKILLRTAPHVLLRRGM
jgi:exopolysaccharide biosynthesis polyprenyl glycosylphosphotransferase